MRIDVSGQVNGIRLPPTHALLPLFEAVVNAVQAVQERADIAGAIEIHIHREYTLAGANGDSPLQQLPEIVGFEVIDNGIGFTRKHFDSFETAFSTLKLEIGGKGVGRLVWLKAFEQAKVSSVFREDGKWWRREFRFAMTQNGIEDSSLAGIEEPQSDNRTSVRLIDFRPLYRDMAPKGGDTIARRIVEHCLVMYMLDRMPNVVLHDTSLAAPIDLYEVYRRDVQQSSEARTFTVEGHELAMRDVLLRPSAATENAIHFCANGREVVSEKLSGAIAHAENPLKANGVELHYAACVTGKLLDQAIDSHRTGFVLDHSNQLALGESPVTWEQVQRAAIAKAAEFLTPKLEEARKRAVERVETFIQMEQPRYRILLERRREDIERLSGNLTDDKLELELHKIHALWRHDAKAQAASRLESFAEDPDSFGKFKADIRAALGELQEVVKADLAEYVIHRRTVLDFFERTLGVMETGTFEREDVLHGLFFPLRTDSDSVDYEDHNLWLIDERLAFHHYLASDIKFTKQSKARLRVSNEKRADLVIFNQPLSFSEENLGPYASIVIVEFKRPERNDYSDGDNPVKQVYGYIRDLRAGKATHRDSGTITGVALQVRFYCYVIVTLTDKLARMLSDSGFRPSPDGQGYFTFNEGLNAFVEVMDYRKVLHDAIRRNKAFFDKLGLHTGTKRPQQKIASD